MANLLILGAGVMGSAIAVPPADNGHAVRLVGTHLDGGIIAALKAGRRHPKLGARLPDAVELLAIEEIDPALADWADIVIVGVSSPGVDWVEDRLARILRAPKPVAFVTKGLVPAGEAPPRTYADTFAAAMRQRAVAVGPFIGIGGPCIARELALRVPTAVIYGSHDAVAVRRFAEIMATPYYRVTVSADAAGVEACAALKNFFAIGVSAMLTRYPDDERGTSFKNPTAMLFQQAVGEMERLTAWIGGRPETAHGLAGSGDLNVTVGGGRNARLGAHLGDGMTVSAALSGPLAGETVEGVDTGRCLLAALAAAHHAGVLEPSEVPLARAILDAIAADTTFRFDFAAIGS